MRKLIADCVEVIKKRLNMDAVNSRMRNSEKLKIGMGERSSTNTKSASATAERVRVPETNGSRQPTWGISFMAKIKRLQGNMRRNAPGKSTEPPLTASLLSSNNFEARYAPEIPIGRLMKHIQGQPTVSIKKPPRVGPVKNPTWKAMEAKPIALPRSWEGKATEAIARPLAEIMAPPIACNPRNKIICAAV